MSGVAKLSRNCVVKLRVLELRVLEPNVLDGLNALNTK